MSVPPERQGGKMTNYYGTIGISLLVLAMLVGGPGSYAAAKTADTHPVQEWVIDAPSGAKAIGVIAWANGPDGKPANQGDPVVVKVKLAKKAYVTALCVSPNGDAVVLFPNRQNPNNLLEADKEYVVFRPDSGVKLMFTEQATDAKVVFYVSETPLDLSPLAIAEGEAYLSLPSAAKKEREILATKIKALAKDETFNTKVLAFNGGKKGSLSLMGLPRAVKSSRPEGIVGIQGAKDKTDKPGKE
ncbi:MAG: DUF4384 domain-containing protein [Deltaproteobacteria bacterium]|nr:DUF4384 domain-containing protein [Deltaproteobacteria bacterium]